MMSEILEGYKIVIPYGWKKPRFTLGDYVKWYLSEEYVTYSIVLGFHYLDEKNAPPKKEGWYYHLKNLRCINLSLNDDCFLESKFDELHQSELESISGSLIRVPA